MDPIEIATLTKSSAFAECEIRRVRGASLFDLCCKGLHGPHVA